MDCTLAGPRAETGPGLAGLLPAHEGSLPPASTSLCMNCEVRSRCIGGIAAEAGTAQLQGMLAGRRTLRTWEVLYRPDQAFEYVYAVRSGVLKSAAGDEVRGFHFPGELVGVDGMAGGRQRVTVTALQETQLCAIRFAPRAVGPGPRAFFARLWDMMSCELVRERAHRSLLATLAPGQRVSAFLASMATRMRRAGPVRLPHAMTSEDIASYLQVPEETVDAALQPGLPSSLGRVSTFP